MYLRLSTARRVVPALSYTWVGSRPQALTPGSRRLGLAMEPRAWEGVACGPGEEADAALCRGESPRSPDSPITTWQPPQMQSPQPHPRVPGFLPREQLGEDGLLLAQGNAGTPNALCPPRAPATPGPWLSPQQWVGEHGLAQGAPSGAPCGLWDTRVRRSWHL